MINFFDKIYSSINDRNDFWTLLKFKSLLRFIIRLFCNMYFPIHFFISSRRYFLNKYSKDKPNKIIVSLTSFPLRINRLYLVVECLLRQNMLPDRILLWLSKEQFQNDGDLPKNLINLKKRGLEIYYVDGDIKSHKKYYYSIKYYPKSLIITVDDDIFYPSHFIKKLYLEHLKYPKAIICHRGKEIVQNANKGYNDWPLLSMQKGPSRNIFFTSGGGTLFPPGSLHSDVLNKSSFMKYCKNADDVWLNYMALLCSTMIFKTSYCSNLLPVISRNNKHLYTYNIHDNGNNSSIKNLEKIYNMKIAKEI